MYIRNHHEQYCKLQYLNQLKTDFRGYSKAETIGRLYVKVIKTTHGKDCFIGVSEV